MRIRIRYGQTYGKRRDENERSRPFMPFPLVPWPIAVRGRFQSEARRMLWGEVSVLDEGDNIIVTARIPGIADEDIEVHAFPNMVSIIGESHTADIFERERPYSSKGSYSKFRRDIYTPVEIDPTSAEAGYENGVLTISLRKTTSKSA